MNRPASGPLDSAEPGGRWVVRARLADGSATDTIGWLEAVTPEEVRLITADGRAESVSRATIVAARRVPAATGGRDPRRVPAAELQRHALPGWLALSEPLGEWTLRSGGGFTGRANSCHALGDPGVPVPDAAARIVAYAAAHDIAPMAQVVTRSAEDAALRDLGWVDTYVATEVLASRLTDLLGRTLPHPAVVVTQTLEPSWWAGYQQSRPNQADPALLRMILDGHPPRAFAGVSDAASGSHPASWPGSPAAT